MNFENIFKYVFLVLVVISPLLINAARTVYISEFKNIDQDYETSQSQKTINVWTMHL